MFSKKDMLQQDKSHPWTEDPKVAYQNFFEFLGMGKEFCSQGMDFFGSKELQLHAENGEFLALKPLLGHPLYCSKVTIRNIKNAELHFGFKNNIIPGILGTDCYDAKAASRLQIAYRNIVPSMFSEATQLAGPMGYHEYIIDGSNYTKGVSLDFTANSETPIQIVLEACEGSCIVTGLDDQLAAKIFVNKCTAEHFTFMNMPPKQDEKSKATSSMQLK